MATGAWRPASEIAAPDAASSGEARAMNGAGTMKREAAQPWSFTWQRCGRAPRLAPVTETL